MGESPFQNQGNFPMADASDYESNIRRYVEIYNKAAAERIVGRLGIALRNRDSASVACSDAGELDRVREKWLRGKLGLAHKQPELDAAITAVCERMKQDGSNKCRVTFYYLLAEHFEKLDELATH
jgi:hypothetical protein